MSRKEPNPSLPPGTARPKPPSPPLPPYPPPHIDQWLKAPPAPPPVREIYESKDTPEPPPHMSAAECFRKTLEAKENRKPSIAPDPPPPPKVVDRAFADILRENIRLTSANHVLEEELKRLQNELLQIRESQKRF